MSAIAELSNTYRQSDGQRTPQEYCPKDTKRGFWYPNSMIKIILLTVFLAFPISTKAQEAQTDPAPSATRIEVNETDNRIEFIINGVTKAVLDADGFKVIGDTYSDSFVHNYSTAPITEEGSARSLEE